MTQATAPINQLVIIDSQINNWQSLISDMGANTAVLIIDSSSDGLTQISDYLSSLSISAGTLNPVSLQSIHIISHGSAGSLSLGATTLNSGNLSNYTKQLAVIGNSLKTKGDVLLYGCHVAQGETGLMFINQFSALTGADVAASDDLTGAATHGGDWDLEARTGGIESASFSLGNYGDVLAANRLGIVTTDFGSYDYGSSVTVQADGKILVAGKSWVGGNYDFALVRYNGNGSLDTSFGSGGKVTTNNGFSDDDGRSVTIQTDGKILVAGYNYNGHNNDIALVRYNSDGSLDVSFDVKDTNDSQDDYGYSVTTQTDGKILLVGSVDLGFGWDGRAILLTRSIPVLLRYNSDGSLDTGFGSYGVVGSGPYHSKGNSVTVQTDGKILVAVVESGFYSFSHDFTLVRYNSNGSLDTSFDDDGIVVTDINFSSVDQGNSVTVQTDGKILVAGTIKSGSYSDFALVRYNNDGSLDTGFDGDGKVTTSFGYNDYGNSVTVQADGKILVAGSTHSWLGNKVYFALARYNSNGSLDTSFGYNGGVITSLGYANNEGCSVTVQTDGKILVAGTSSDNNNSDFALVPKT